MIPLGALAFLVFVWPTVWRYSTYEGRAVRVHRLTNEVQFAQKIPGGTAFREFGANNEPGAHPSARLPAAGELARVTLRNVRILYLSLIHISEPTRVGMMSYAAFCL